MSGVREARRMRARRARRAEAGIVACGLVLTILALTTGTYDIPVTELPAAIAGTGDAKATRVLETLRAPRLLVALATGAAFGAAGGLFQSITRNPLGSPDVVGFTQGAAAGAVLLIVVAGSVGTVAIAAASIAGGLGAAALVIGLSVTAGRIGADRIVLVGIGIGALLTSITTWLLAVTDLARAQGAAVWLTGTLNGRSWEQLWPMLAALAVLAPAAAVIARSVAILELGDDLAAGVGVRPWRTRLVAVLVAVGLAAVATATVGPIPFVALAAPHVARRLTRLPGPALGACALSGATLLLASDLLAQRISPAGPLPAGVVTGAAGGVFLAWLLVRDWKESHR